MPNRDERDALARVVKKKVGTTIRADELDEIVRILERPGAGASDVSEFVRQAVREKVDRWKREHPGGPPPR